jgi:hypothetical protein
VGAKQERRRRRAADVVVGDIGEGHGMGRLFDTVRQLVQESKYVIGQHASERLEQRGIMEWQAVAGLDEGELIAERLDASPIPAR